MKPIFFLLFSFIFAFSSYADPIRYDNAPMSLSDGTTVVYPYQIKVTAGTLTNNNDGTASLTTGGGGSSLSGLHTNAVPVANSSTTVIDSAIYSVGNNVGIGTTTPSTNLHILGAENDSYGQLIVQ